MNQNEDPTGDRADVYSRPSAYFDGDGALVVRASAASSCRRALWYAATEQQPTNPPTDESLTVMEAGQALEQVVLRAMERASWDVIPVGPLHPLEVTLLIAPDLRVTGHPDATAVLPFFGGPEVIVEVKTRGPDAYKRWQTLGAERSHPESVAQAALYTYGKYGEARDVVIATMDTGSRAWDTETIPADRVEDAMEAVSFRLGELADHYGAHGQNPDELPERDFRAGSWQCRTCPFLNTCKPGTAEVEGDTGEASENEGREVSTEEVRAAVRAYLEAQEALREPEQAKRRALDTLKAWMRQRGMTKASVEGRAVSLVKTRRFSVDYRKLNALLDPDTRAGIVTEAVSQYVRVS